VSIKPASAPPSQLSSLDPPVQGLILDVDGVLWKGSEPIGDLAAVFRTISTRGLRVVLATNNAMKSVEDYRVTLQRLGVDIEARQIVTSAEATADALVAAFPRRGILFVVGELGLVQALRDRGFEVSTDPGSPEDFVGVVGGIDRQLTYLKLQRAADLVRGGLPFYGTNPDSTFPTPAGLIPGAGAVLAAIASAAGRQPVVIGKPSPLLFQIAAARAGLTAENALVVGDRIETDVAGGQAFGARTALVLSGVSTREQAASWSPPPTLVAKSLSDLLGL
jgi:4-nitrophenyl phosphatase